MSTGISISSINRIKELAEEKKFEEALEILDTQNLDKSINPQFLRISGEIFRENKRYYDSRKILLKAHQMSPQGLRIIEELIKLYLELGYFQKAQRYYEQYLFYTTPEDNQKEYVEYIIKKGTGATIKELASILIPILERLPEDRWNFEAVLLYDKLGRKDKALDESRYILENFKESVYVKPVIDYIEDKLDVDAYFYVYPRQEQEESQELFGDLMEEEEKLLEADYLRMYPPEAKIMVEAEDKEALDVKPAKEKKSRKRKKAVLDSVDLDEDGEKSTEKKNAKKRKSTEAAPEQNSDEYDEVSEDISTDDSEQAVNPVEEKVSLSEMEEDLDVVNEEQIKHDREEELEKILSQKINTDQIRESAKQAVKAVKEMDADKAKQQIKSVAKTMKGNVKKATDALGEVVGVKAAETENFEELKQQTEIVDGIIESVLEPPKKTVGEVVTNEELDALVPESLEAMSTTEIADLEAKKAEAERLELEAIEAQLKLEEEKKSKYHSKRKSVVLDSDIVQNIDETNNHMASVSGEEFTQLKEKFLAATAEEEDESPLESLGFITVVQSDIDAKMEEEIPDTAGILHQMIDNKEFYSGEDSTMFESKSSYENHGFEIEDFAFDAFNEVENIAPTQAQLYDNSINEDEDIPTVETIYAQEDVVEFNEMIPNESVDLKQEKQILPTNGESFADESMEISNTGNTEFSHKDFVYEKKDEYIASALVEDEKNVVQDSAIESKMVENEQTTFTLEETESLQNTTVLEETESEQTVTTFEEVESKQTVTVLEEAESGQTVTTLEEVESEQTVTTLEEVESGQTVTALEEVESGQTVTTLEEVESEQTVTVLEEAESRLTATEMTEAKNEQVIAVLEKPEMSLVEKRQQLRVKILITENMTQKLMDLKESR